MRILIKRAPDGKITLQEGAKIAIVTINRPAVRNALTSNMWKELKRIGLEIKANPKNKVVIIRGSDGNFMSGSDIKEFYEMSAAEANDTFALMEETISTFENLPIPVIGAIDGPSLGAGFIFSLACDIRVGTPAARMGIPVSRLGIKLSPGFVQRITALIGPSRTKELVMTNAIYDYKTSYELGLLNRIVSSEELDRTVIEMAENISRQSRASLKAVKESVKQGFPVYEEDPDFIDITDFYEGCMAFIEKRKPNFK